MENQMASTRISQPGMEYQLVVQVGREQYTPIFRLAHVRHSSIASIVREALDLLTKKYAEDIARCPDLPLPDPTVKPQGRKVVGSFVEPEDPS